MAPLVLEHEPHQALFVRDRDPLQFYRSIAAAAQRVLAPDGELWVEINEALSRETCQLLRDKGFKKLTVYRDIHEKERFIRARG
jgi:release factor glutamine methyltransferase